MQWLLGTCCRRLESGGRYGRLSTDDNDEGGQPAVRWRSSAFLVALGLGAAVWVLGMMQALALAAAALVGTLVWHRRRVHVFWVAYGIRSDFKATRAAARALSNPSAAELQTLWGGVHERSAERMLATVNSLQGLWIKTAQLLATRADISELPSAADGRTSQRRVSLTLQIAANRSGRRVHPQVQDDAGQHASPAVRRGAGRHCFRAAAAGGRLGLAACSERGRFCRHLRGVCKPAPSRAAPVSARWLGA